MLAFWHFGILRHFGRMFAFGRIARDSVLMLRFLSGSHTEYRRRQRLRVHFKMERERWHWAKAGSPATGIDTKSYLEIRRITMQSKMDRNRITIKSMDRPKHSAKCDALGLTMRGCFGKWHWKNWMRRTENVWFVWPNSMKRMRRRERLCSCQRAKIMDFTKSALRSGYSLKGTARSVALMSTSDAVYDWLTECALILFDDQRVSISIRLSVQCFVAFKSEHEMNWRGDM